jgi:hypothetical protein
MDFWFSFFLFIIFLNLLRVFSSLTIFNSLREYCPNLKFVGIVIWVVVEKGHVDFSLYLILVLSAEIKNKKIK